MAKGLSPTISFSRRNIRDTQAQGAISIVFTVDTAVVITDPWSARHMASRTAGAHNPDQFLSIPDHLNTIQTRTSLA